MLLDICLHSMYASRFIFCHFFVFYLLSLEHAMWQLRFDVYVTFYLAMQFSPHYHWRPQRGGKLDQGLWKSWRRQIRGRDLAHVFAAKSVSQKVQHTIKKPLVTTAENQRSSEPLFFKIHSIHPLTLQKG